MSGAIGCSGGCIGNLFLRIHFWNSQYSQHIALVYVVAFLYFDFCNAPRQFASYTIFADFNLALNNLFVLS